MPAVEPALAAGIVAAALATYLLAAMLVPRSAVVLAAQGALVVTLIAATVAVARVQPAGQRARHGLAMLGLRGAAPRYFAAAIAIGTTAWYLNLHLTSLLPIPARETRVLVELVGRPSLGVAVALFAVLPALCEELLFRGVLARSLGRAMSLAGAAAVSAVVFSAYHLSLAQALPTLTLGFVLALLAIRADSVLPVILAHAINNTLAIAMTRGALPSLADALVKHPAIALAGGAAATATGIAITVRRAAR